jgi:cytochrome c-type biogenesis protein CcmF
MHYFIGSLGKELSVIAFVTALFGAIAYIVSLKNPAEKERWIKMARACVYIHAASVLGMAVTLFFIINNHYFEYHYAFSHSSKNIPIEYIISSFWEGQEGSFLLWIFWDALILVLILPRLKEWENSFMTVSLAVQAFLTSMLLGVVLFDALKIGSSPFMLLRDVSDAPIFALNPEYIPEDGNGLNPLLQNYWMVIHPPVIFLSFALMLIPFAFTMAGLITGRFTQWTEKAFPWTLATAGILGLGIMMGAYWAYETLNFGGFWSWDPVENAVYIPWIFLVAAVHTLIIHRKKGGSLKASAILISLSFVLVLYSTFLTRSGVLGDSSVHSFTDLGLSGQLLLYLSFFALGAGIIIAKSWKNLPSDEKEATVYSKEFWIYLSALILVLTGTQVFIPTSIPVFNALLNSIGLDGNYATPGDQVEFYNKYQLWFGVAIAIASGLGQYMYWRSVNSVGKLKETVLVPAGVALLLSALLFVVLPQEIKPNQFSHIILIASAVFIIVANGHTLLTFRSKVKLSGGAMAHLGIGLLLIGVVFSGGYSQIESMNLSGKPYSSNFTDDVNKENLLLFQDAPRPMGNYTLIYKGKRAESREFPGYIDWESLIPTEDLYLKITTEDLVHDGKVYKKTGDTIHVFHENTYYQIDFVKGDNTFYTLYPRVQDNEKMGTAVSPAIRKSAASDLYAHITTIAKDADELEWREPETHNVSVGDTLFLNDYVAIFEGVQKKEKVPGVPLGANDVAIRADVRVLSRFGNKILKPYFIIKGNQIGTVADTKAGLGLRLVLENISPETNTFTFKSQTAQKDWIIMKAETKPLINLVWVGTIICVFGFAFSARQRFLEGRKRKKKGSKNPPRRNEQNQKLQPV